MIDIAIYHPNESLGEALEDFLNLYHGSHMHRLASDLLQEGFSVKDVMESVRRAMSICRTAGMDLRPHFQLVYTQLDGTLVRDCKLSDFGYALVLMNGPADHPRVASWQIRMTKYFNG
ncbi:MAG: hypothetical protein H6577_06815 [Lewinellaceae bacterium]|nr:hypothetical protein [Saprospiraceae bacterium]MCB9337821.1 hypothetical protein [Lewinellaceae bacterium]